MRNAATYRRAVASAGLALTAVLMATAMGMGVPFSGAGVLAAMSDAGDRAWLSATTYLLAQLAMIPAALGLAHLLRQQAPALSNLGATLMVLGAFGHTVHGGSVLLTIQMAADQTHHSTHAAVLDAFASSPAGIFSLMGLLGTVLGLIMLTVGIWRVRLGPRWVAPALAAFIVLEFVGAAISPIAGLVAGALYVAAFVTLAHTARRSPTESWGLVTETREPQRVAP